MKGESIMSGSLSEAIKREVADREQCEPGELGDLRRAVDIERLVEVRNPPIEFTYCGYDVRIDADRKITIDM